MTLQTVNIPTKPLKPGVAAHRAVRLLVDKIAPKAVIPSINPVVTTVPKIMPPRQPLPAPTLYLGKPSLKLGLDVHLEFITAVVQRDHTAPQAPRKFTREQLIQQVRKWVAEGLVVYAVEESCGFGFVLHRQLVEAGAQSFLITPIALNGKRKTDKLDARALCVRLSRWIDGNKDELSPIRIPTEAEQRAREISRRRKFLSAEIRRLALQGLARRFHRVFVKRHVSPVVSMSDSRRDARTSK